MTHTSEHERSSTIDKKTFFDDLGYEPPPGQAKVHESGASRRILASGVRWGKTLCASMEGLAASMAPRKRSVGWVVASTYDLCDRVFREIVMIAAEHLRHRIVTLKENERRLVIRNMSGGMSEIRGKSADNPVSLLGEGLDWVIVDEAARLKPAIWEGHLTQRLLDKRGWALLISTPSGKGWFHDLFRRGQGSDPAFESWNSPSSDNPLLDREQIEAERDRLPQRVISQEYEAKFIEGAGAVFRGVRELATDEFEEPKPDAMYYGGLDLAKTEDFTVLVILDKDRNVVFVDRFQRVDWVVQVNRIVAATQRYNDCSVYTDTTGKGEPVYEALRRAGCRAKPYLFTQRSKAALIDNLSILFEKKKMRLPRYELWPEGIDELEAFQYSVSNSGNTRSGAPSGAHDDCVIALALAAWPLKRTEPLGYAVTCSLSGPVYGPGRWG